MSDVLKVTTGDWKDYYSGCAARLTDGTLIWIETTGDGFRGLPDLTPHTREQQMDLSTPRWPEGAEL